MVIEKGDPIKSISRDGKFKDDKLIEGKLIINEFDKLVKESLFKIIKEGKFVDNYYLNGKGTQTYLSANQKVVISGSFVNMKMTLEILIQQKMIKLN